MQSTLDKEWDTTIIALAHKIQNLKDEIEVYKANDRMKDARISNLKNEVRNLKAQIGLYKIRYEETKNHKDMGSNGLELGEFE